MRDPWSRGSFVKHRRLSSQVPKYCCHLSCTFISVGMVVMRLVHGADWP